ncbi:MAG: sugar-binding transcriptional regulator [Alphaproteobacteria bacterium]|nr:sugar-binding transcriptional regulator [Alphaproteobacteria bacterium]
MARPARTLKIDEEERLLVRIAWACEIEGITQAAAATRFGITRLRVNKALAEARRRGIVRVSINSVYSPCAELEIALSNHYGISHARVVPTPDDPAAVQTIVGIALGHHLAALLMRPQVRLFGMSWGNTLNLATRHMEPINRPDLEIVSVMGGLTKGSELNVYEITQRLADLCNADHSYFTAPIYAGSAQSRDVLITQDVFGRVIEKIRSADALAMAAGDMSQSLLIRDGLPSEFTAQELIEAGAVGDVLGYMLDEDGNLIDHPINERLIGIELEDLRAIPDTILAAGGAHKVPIMRGFLGKGYVNTLVTDEQTARALL